MDLSRHSASENQPGSENQPLNTSFGTPSNSREIEQNIIRPFFSGQVDYVMTARLGIADSKLADYLSELLTTFVRTDNLLRARDLRGRRLSQISDLLEEAECRVGEAKGRLYHEAARLALFYTGYYPEHFETSKVGNTKDSCLNIWSVGPSAFYNASLNLSAGSDESDFLQTMGEKFEIGVFALSETRRSIEEDGTAMRLAATDENSSRFSLLYLPQGFRSRPS